MDDPRYNNPASQQKEQQEQGIRRHILSNEEHYELQAREMSYKMIQEAQPIPQFIFIDHSVQWDDGNPDFELEIPYMGPPAAASPQQEHHELMKPRSLISGRITANVKSLTNGAMSFPTIVFKEESTPTPSVTADHEDAEEESASRVSEPKVSPMGQGSLVLETNATTGVPFITVMLDGSSPTPSVTKTVPFVTVEHDSPSSKQSRLVKELVPCTPTTTTVVMVDRSSPTPMVTNSTLETKTRNVECSLSSSSSSPTEYKTVENNSSAKSSTVMSEAKQIEVVERADPSLLTPVMLAKQPMVSQVKPTTGMTKENKSPSTPPIMTDFVHSHDFSPMPITTTPVVQQVRIVLDSHAETPEAMEYIHIMDDSSQTSSVTGTVPSVAVLEQVESGTHFLRYMSPVTVEHHNTTDPAVSTIVEEPEATSSSQPSMVGTSPMPSTMDGFTTPSRTESHPSLSIERVSDTCVSSPPSVTKQCFTENCKQQQDTPNTPFSVADSSSTTDSVPTSDPTSAHNDHNDRGNDLKGFRKACHFVRNDIEDTLTVIKEDIKTVDGALIRRVFMILFMTWLLCSFYYHPTIQLAVRRKAFCMPSSFSSRMPFAPAVPMRPPPRGLKKFRSIITKRIEHVQGRHRRRQQQQRMQ